MGHRNHHLCLWHLADKRGILDEVLNTSSHEVAVDLENVQTNTAEVVTKRKRITKDKEERNWSFSFTHCSE